MDGISNALPLTILGNETATTFHTSNIFAIPDYWLSLLSLPAVRESVKLFIFGIAIESARRLLMLVYTHCVDMFFITAEFDERDETFSV